VAQPQECLQRVLARNWPDVKEAVFALPRENPRQIATADWCERVLDSLHERRTIYYGAARKSPRIYAIGNTIHLLPRKLRQLALAGGVELDLKAAQLAIVSKLWDVPSLREFLSVPTKSIWDELQEWIGVSAEYKPVLKAANYSVVFGMGTDQVAEMLAHGTAKNDGVGSIRAAKFFTHPLVRDLITARSRIFKQIKDDHGAEDAFGRLVEIEWDSAKKKCNVPSVAAQVIQSWEMRLMLRLVPVLRAQRQLYCLSFLHDGLTVWCGDVTKRDRHIQMLKSAVQVEADRCGFPTWLE
jgi:hypothetical protein